METPRVKLLMRYPKEWLVRIARDYNLPTEGTKLLIARRIARTQDKQAQKDWDVIVNGDSGNG